MRSIAKSSVPFIFRGKGKSEDDDRDEILKAAALEALTRLGVRLRAVEKEKTRPAEKKENLRPTAKTM
jgi:hypothetical protein